jgi:putative phosphoribosyl transferase
MRTCRTCTASSTCQYRSSIVSEIVIPVGEHRIAAEVRSPAGEALGTVLFVHGSGVDRHDARNQFLADRLRTAGFATVLFDLLEPRETRDYQNVFDIELQTTRLLGALDDLQRGARLPAPLGIFSTGVGAGVALLAAATRPAAIRAIVARSGRPDIALFWLPRVEAPTLLIVPQPDACNELALERLPVEKELVIVPSASGFFQEPEALEAVAAHTLRWFARHLCNRSQAE